MATSNQPQSDHPLVADLDSVFTGSGGNAPALAGWLEYLAHPEENSGPRVLEFADGSGIESSGKPHPNTTDHVLERTVLRDLTLDRFFAHANVLSGQQTGTLTDDGEISSSPALSTTYDLIEEVRLKRVHDSTRPQDSADVWTNLRIMVDAVVSRENWDGGAADNAREKYSTMVQWYENHRNPALTAMNEFLVKFSSIILKARTDVNELMGKTVATLNKLTEHDPLEDLLFAVSALDKILDVALNLPKTATDAALFVTDALKSVTGHVAKSGDDSGFGIDATDVQLGYYRMLESFIGAGDKVCWEAADAVATLITDADNGLLFVRQNWVPAPAWPR